MESTLRVKERKQEMDEMYRWMLSGGRQKERKEERDEMYRGRC
jgi:hypothetical protein